MKQFLLVILLLPFFANAQSWKWINGQTYGNWCLVDGYLCKTSSFNSIYVGGLMQDVSSVPDSVLFGSYKFYCQPSESKVVLAKYDTLGNQLWVIANEEGYAYPTRIETDNGGNLYLLGWCFSDSLVFSGHLFINPNYIPSLGHSAYNFSYFIAKFDSSGNVLWLKMGCKVTPYMGVSLTQGGIAVDSYKNIYVLSSYWDSLVTIGSYKLVNAHAGTSDILVAKYDSLGNEIWAKSFGGVGDDYGMAIGVGKKDDIYITGTFNSDSILFEGSTVKYSIGSAPYYNNPDLYIAKLDSDGSIYWARSSIGSAASFAIATDDNINGLGGGIYICGAVYDSSIFQLGSFSFHKPYMQQSSFLAKYDGNGNTVWVKNLYPATNPNSASSRSSFWGLTTDRCHNVWTSGIRLDSILIDTGIFVHAPSVSGNTLIIEYSDAGKELQYQAIPVLEDDNSGLSSDYNGNIYICEDAGGKVTLGGVSLTPTIRNEGMFVAKFYPGSNCDFDTSTNIQNTLDQNSLSCYPNPAVNTLQITSTNKIQTISILNTIGQTVYTNTISTNKAEIDIQSLQPGLYFIQVIINGQKTVMNFVKE
jgi:hypothetical protein